MLEFYISNVTIQRQKYLNFLSWSQCINPFIKNVEVKKDIICIKMKKLIDLCYISCKAIIDSNNGEPLTGCICYSNESGYIIDLFKDEYVYTIIVTPSRVSVDTSGSSINGIDFIKSRLSEKTYTKVEDMVSTTIDELENLRKQWKAL